MLNAPQAHRKNEQRELKVFWTLMKQAVFCDCRDTLGFVTFYEERINLGLMKFFVHELPPFLSMALPVLHVVFEGFVTSGLFPALCSEQMMFESSVQC